MILNDAEQDTYYNDDKVQTNILPNPPFRQLLDGNVIERKKAMAQTCE